MFRAFELFPSKFLVYIWIRLSEQVSNLDVLLIPRGTKIITTVYVKSTCYTGIKPSPKFNNMEDPVKMSCQRDVAYYATCSEKEMCRKLNWWVEWKTKSEVDWP